MFLSGNQGEALSLESVDAAARHHRKDAGTAGIHAYVAGSAAQIADQFEVGNEGTLLTTVSTVVVIALMLLIVYRSPVTMILALITVLVEMAAARGIVSFLANAGVIGLSTYSTNILTLLVIAAGTDYVIFLLGRYHEKRNEGMDREAAFYDMYRGTAHVILGSGLTIAGAVFCLYFTRMPYFQSLGIPAAIGVLIALAASLTLAPAVLVVPGRWAHRWTTPRSRSRSARTVPRRSTTCPSSRTAPATCSSRWVSSTTRSTCCGSSMRCSSSPATSRTNRARHFRRRSPRRRTCATRSPTSTTSSGRCGTTSIGSHTVSTSRSVSRSDPSSMRSTASTS